MTNQVVKEVTPVNRQPRYRTILMISIIVITAVVAITVSGCNENEDDADIEASVRSKICESSDTESDSGICNCILCFLQRVRKH